MPASSKTLALLLLVILPLAAQQPVDDPANLMGERTAAPVLSDTLPIDHGAPALEQLLRKLRTRASLMMIVAHPDDEDGGMLTLESRGVGARVAVLTLTRGEGGQNLMSGDFGDALGLIRTQELLAADRTMGVDQFFGTEVDFGFSKTKEEAFKKWTHERVLYDAVRCVRLYRPLVLASVFVGAATDGHGHHQVAGEITQEVFVAAADPKVFPEMGLPPWAPLKVYARVPFSRVTPDGMYDYATGKTIPTRFENYVTRVISHVEPTATVILHEGDQPRIAAFNGMSYVQWARQGLALQKSQIGAGVRVPPPGIVDVGYTLMGSRAEGAPTSQKRDMGHPDADLFSGIDTSLAGIAALAPASSPALRVALQTIDAQLMEAVRLFDPGHLERTAPPLRTALTALNALIASTEASQLGSTQKFNVLHELRIKHVQLEEALNLASGTNPAAERTEAPVPRPYFARPNLEQPYYDVAVPALRNAPATPTSDNPSQVPAVSISLSPRFGLISSQRLVAGVTATVTPSSASPPSGICTVRLEAPQGWIATPASTNVSCREPSSTAFQVTDTGASRTRSALMRGVVTSGREQFHESYRAVGYPGLTSTSFYSPATFKATLVDVKTAPYLRVAYLPGTGDDVPTYLPSLGVTPTILSAKDLNASALKQYNVVLLGVRAYAAHPELSGSGSQPLVDYAKAGGVVILQYNSGNFNSASVPYPFTLPGDPAHNVVEEEEPVSIALPSDPLLNWPNRITARDFDHWVEERGHGFASEWAPEYKAPLEMHDAGQDPQRGGLLVAPVGKGAYVYCALALYRQLPEGVPGAYRLLANLLSYAKNPQR